MTSQIIINILISSCEFLLIAVSFSVIYQVTKFFHFAHAVIFAFGAYFSFLFTQILGLYLYTSIPLAIIGACLLGCLMEISIYKPLRKKKSSAIILLLASLGIYIVLQNLISLFFGDDTKSIRTWQVREGINIAGAYITPVQIVIVAGSLLLVILVTCIWLKQGRQ